MLVIGRDGHVRWSKSSTSALKSGRYFKTRGNVPPVPIPAASLAMRPDVVDLAREGTQHPAGVWYDEECLEYSIQSDRYDQTVTLLHFPKYAPSRFEFFRK